MTRRAIYGITLLAALAVSGCVPGSKLQLSPDETPMVFGSRARQNTTINTETFRCLDGKIAARKKPRLNVAIGNIADYTGKVSDTEGAMITKGGSLMLFSALGLMPQSIRLHDRFDTSVTDLEMTYINARQLGDGQTHEVDGTEVPWMPYYGGSIQKSDYTILGGITEVNFNISSGGYSAQINQVGPRKRSFTMSVAADLRMIRTDSLVVVATSSFQKQFTGHEIGANLFSFFDVFGDKQLFDVYAGNIAQEPMQLGVRAILEEATLELLSKVTEVDYRACAIPAPRFTPNLPTITPAAKEAKLTAPPKPPKPVAAVPAENITPAVTETTAVTASPPAPPPAPPPPPSPQTSGPVTGTLMVGVFSSQESAAKAAEVVSSLGVTPRVQPEKTRKGELWSVRVFTTRADAVLARVRSLGFPDAYYLPDQESPARPGVARQ